MAGSDALRPLSEPIVPLARLSSLLSPCRVILPERTYSYYVYVYVVLDDCVIVPSYVLSVLDYAVSAIFCR